MEPRLHMNIGGRDCLLTPDQYSRAMAKLRVLDQKNRQVSRELRTAHVLPREHHSLHHKAYEPSLSPAKDAVEISNRAAWLADRAKRLGESFETFKPRTPNLSRMNEAFSKLSA